MSERDELAELIASAEYPNMNPPWAERKDRSPVKYYSRKYADVLIAAGYRKPRQITTVEELDALPYGSAVLTSDISDTVVLRSDREYFVNQSGCTINARTLWDYGSKPFTVLYEPLP